jgi:hypothetical protein
MSYESAFKKRCLIITNRPIKWSKNTQDVFTLSDMLNGIDKKLNDKKKKEQSKLLKDSENKVKEKERIENENKQLQKKMEKLQNSFKQLSYNETKLSNEINASTIPKTEKIQKQKKLESIQKMKRKIEEEKEKIEDDYFRITEELSKLEEDTSKLKEDASKLEEDGENINNKKNYKIKFNIVIIDDSITNTDVETFRKDFSFDLFMELKTKYMKKYSILIKPIDLHHNQQKWYKKGIFRFKKDKVYDILSFNVYVDFKNLIHDSENIVEFKSESLVNDRKAALEEKLRLAREEAYTSKNQRVLEIKIEKIYTVKDYSDFIENRKIFTRFLLERITEKNMKDKIKSSEMHKYSNTILVNIDKKYEGTIFPYNETNPLSIYYVVFLHNHLKSDPLYEKFEMKIANTIGDFGSDPLMKGIIIQSVNFPAIPYYDPVKVFKIYNDDNYFVYMKPEFNKVNGLQMYESHMKKMNMIRNNLHKKKDAIKLEQGGASNRKTFKKTPRQSKNKTFSNRI